jgi:hypothetical protein
LVSQSILFSLFKRRKVAIFNLFSFDIESLRLNPFISITPSKPLISSWLTLHNCDIYYLSAVKYDPATTDLIFVRVNIYPGPGEGDLQLISEPVYFIRVTIYPAAFPHNIRRGHYLPGGVGGGGILLIFQPIYFYQGHYLPHHHIPQY